jgi:hypothetical protein
MAFSVYIYLMSISLSPDFPPLLPPGFHIMSMAEIRELCVTPFLPASTTRGLIMGDLELIHNELACSGIKCELWIDGSFLTQKVDPADVDILLCVDGPFINSATVPQQDLVMKIASNLKPILKCDSYVVAVFPDGHPSHINTMNVLAYWRGLFGFSRQLGPKGIAIIKY